MANRAGQNRSAPATPRAILPPVVLLLSLDSDLIWLSFATTSAWIAVQSSDWSPGWTTATRLGSRPAHAPSIAISASVLTIVLIIDILSPSPSGGTARPRAPQSSTGIALNGAYVRLCRAGRIDLGRQSIDPRGSPAGWRAVNQWRQWEVVATFGYTREPLRE